MQTINVQKLQECPTSKSPIVMLQPAMPDIGLQSTP
jgi:hypothetical protein